MFSKFVEHEEIEEWNKLTSWARNVSKSWPVINIYLQFSSLASDTWTQKVRRPTMFLMNFI